jgi:hypothetical protein
VGGRQPDAAGLARPEQGGAPGDIADDGGLLALNSVDGDPSAVVRTDPAAWRDELCRVVGEADLTAADRAAHPGIPDGRVCGGGQ